MEYENKIIIITGGCSGIGGEITKYLLKKGAFVIPTTRNINCSNTFLNTIDDEYKSRCFPFELSLEKQEYISDFIIKIKSQYKKIYALINCAVCREPVTNFYELNIEEWDKHYRINVFATAYLSGKVAEELIMKDGSIVNFSSFYSINIPDNRVYDKGTIPTSLIYASSKAALNYITQYMAVIYAERNITVNAILAGGVENKDRQTPFFTEQYCLRTPMKRMAKSSDFNKAVDFFISNDNKYCTGQLLSIDGGWNLL
ncbi:NAD(P)-dependent dehydrogenase (short-subunit alcohol dehydrogenase family) [Lachnotalea glycerini]|uniref:NAD(P)-dependent dehydrogenase (Short-subunit alcohol dehydrogenase family) n=1 Tax=Lachnotalea glycerini TaxID=1763509 RepID=A0A318EQH2_9FIRM|nr:SDR family oxidoreductase [Lachnotalea glycerini]PXV91844.1 NAD(P)-dependent dehydrogenase (short-subunit alcohol dehydrogenase family) [Lachnotalea glycerini]